MINLSEFLGCKIEVEFVAGGFPLTGIVGHSSEPAYPYSIDQRWFFTEDGMGLSMGRIKSIKSWIKPVNRGIAHCHPNITLRQFVNQYVYAKLNNGVELLGVVCKNASPEDLYVFSSFSVKENGSFEFGDNYITEIYNADAFQIVTKSTFDAPVDTAVEEAKKMLKDFTAEQIAQLLYSLKK